MLINSAETNSNTFSAIPAGFFPEVQTKYSSSLLLTNIGSELLDRHPLFFNNLSILIQQMENRIDGLNSILNITNQHAEDILNREPPIILNSPSEGTTYSIKLLSRGSESWVFLVNITSEQESYVLKMPTQGLRIRIKGPLQELLERSAHLPFYEKQLKVTQALNDQFYPELNSAKIRLPTYLMASDFFSIVKYEEGGEIDPRIFKEKLVPLGKDIQRKITLAAIEGNDLWQGVVIDWMYQSDSFRLLSDGSIVCVDPIVII